MGFSATVCKKEKSSDVYFDYTTLMVGFTLDSTKIEWRLDSSVTWTDYQSWEKDMDHDFHRCRTLDRTFGGRVEYVLARRHVDEQVATWWHEERSAKGMTGGTSSWEEFKQFLCARFLERSMESNKVVVPEVQARVAEDDTPLRGMSIQLHKVATGDKAVIRNQRWSLFQTQCTIKEKKCKLIIDSGSYCNGISKAMVESLGLSTWRILEPKHVEWLNSCVC
jgi:hypothetical protein